MDNVFFFFKSSKIETFFSWWTKHSFAFSHCKFIHFHLFRFRRNHHQIMERMEKTKQKNVRRNDGFLFTILQLFISIHNNSFFHQHHHTHTHTQTSQWRLINRLFKTRKHQQPHWKEEEWNWNENEFQKKKESENVEKEREFSCFFVVCFRRHRRCVVHAYNSSWIFLLLLLLLQSFFSASVFFMQHKWLKWK